MEKKFYAVKKGLKTGIFDTWNEVEGLVKGFSGAEYKSFASKDEADEYLKKDIFSFFTQPEVTICGSKITSAFAFIKSSLDRENNTYGYGGFLVDSGISFPVYGYGFEKGSTSNLLLLSEIDGTLSIAQKAKELDIKRLIILYNNEGIEKWITGAWNANQHKTQIYRDAMHELISEGLAIKFFNINKIDNLTGIEYAQKLADLQINVCTNQTLTA